MTIRDLIPFNWRRERDGESRRAVARREDQEWQSPFDLMGRDVDELFDSFFRDWPSAWQHHSLQPRVNLSETDDAYEIEAEMPGLDEKDIDVRVENDRLIIRGERSHETRDEKKGRLHRIERSYGSFQRALPLPDAVKCDQAKADYRNGVLTITLPKDAAKAAPSKRIPIKAG